MLRIGMSAPDFIAETTEGTIRFYEWLGDSWALLFSHPKDFTPVCTTELGEMARLKPEFDRRHCKVLGLSVDSVADHGRWMKDVEQATGYAINFPLVADEDLSISKMYGMLPDTDGGSAGSRTALDNQTVRCVFMIAPDRIIRSVIAYPMTTGRNAAELLRVLDSIQLTARHKVATPVNWQQGEEVIIVPSLGDDAAAALFPEGWRAPLPYMRMVSVG